MPNIDGQVYFQGEMIPRSIYTHIKEDLCVLQVQDALALGEEVLAPFLASRCERVGERGAAFWVACPGFESQVPVRDAAGEVQGTFSRCTDLPGGEGEIATIALADLPFPVTESEPTPTTEDCPQCDDGVEAEDDPNFAEMPVGPAEILVADPPAPRPLIPLDAIETEALDALVGMLQYLAGRIPSLSLPVTIKEMDEGAVRRLAREVAQNPTYIEEWDQSEEQEIADIRSAEPTYSSPLLGYTRTDAGNGDRLINQYGSDIRYCDTFKSWYIWDGQRWHKDDRLQIMAIATRVARSIYIEAGHCPDPDIRTALGKWAVVSEGLARRKAMVESAAPFCAIGPTDMDARLNLLNCQNGTLELDSLTFREHRREDLLSKCCGVDFDEAAECPTWLGHLDLVFDGDEAYIRGFQELCGYSLLAENPEQILAILYGSGKNGKSVTVRAIAHVLGDYAVNIAADSLMVKRGDGPRSDIARLCGARMVTTSEGSQGARLDESMVKILTGGDRVTVRRLYENEFEFSPGAKIFFSTNHEPQIVGTDEGIWRRIWLLPFVVTIPESKRDRGIDDRLAAEGSGILNWMIEGLRRYIDNRRILNPPAKVVAATRRFRNESDAVGRFLGDKCVFESSGTCGRSNLYKIYLAWCEEEGEQPISARRFNTSIRDRGLNERKSSGARLWQGLRVKTQYEEDHEVDTGDRQGIL